ncbi:endonuclease [Vibrio galatheae]|uniref:Endonuclease n=1 Tax=Vibrio galatheae TaxID=579748 RepID=A0A0F4NJ34_9VIBR|nr:endonuclease/exonuclease/phosphatase family protein [Vibrio galatheae]KJY82934.1 endonuclease [Vibrio galatheae]
MLTDKTLTFATANLFNFIEPPGAYYDFENIYERDAWQEKCRWTKEQIKKLDADIVGIQEVFSIEAAQALFSQLGYHHFAVVDKPNVEQEYIYSHPVVALASKYPIKQIQAVEPPSSITENYHVATPKFSRQPLYAIIDVPDIGEIAVYVCHLKSQRATESHLPEKAHSIVGRWLSSQQRGWEAVMLRVFMEQQYANHPLPTVLLGDMNQALTSDITSLLTTSADISGQSLQLTDSWQIYSQTNNKAQRPATHYHFATGNVLDYVLLSPEFQPDSPYSLADVVAYQTLDTHLINPSFETDKQASDHAFVAVTVQFVL